MRLLIVLFVILFSSEASYARRSKAEKKQDTKDLREFMQLLDHTLDDPGHVKAEIAKVRQDRMFLLGELISARLSKKRRAEFLVSLNQYVQGATNTEAQKKALHESLRSLTYRYFRVVTAPAQTPSMALAKKLYMEHCVSCHGARLEGNGVFVTKAKQEITVKPKSFPEQYDQGLRSPYSYFNSILSGGHDSFMPSYQKQLSSHDMWSLAFYLSLPPSSQTYEKKDLVLPSMATLKDIAESSNYSLKTGGYSDDQIRFLRSRSSFNPRTPVHP